MSVKQREAACPARSMALAGQRKTSRTGDQPQSGPDDGEKAGLARAHENVAEGESGGTVLNHLKGLIEAVNSLRLPPILPSISSGCRRTLSYSLGLPASLSNLGDLLPWVRLYAASGCPDNCFDIH